MERRIAASYAAALILLVISAGAAWGRDRGSGQKPPGPADAAFWEKTVRAFERRDAAHPPRRGSVLFIGSSSVRLWDSLARDMDPLAVINRGFGGSEIEHITHYVDRLVAPYDPRGIVFYAGDNDLARDQSAGPESVLRDFEAFVAATARAGIHAPIYFISIKPSLVRAARWPTMAAANALVARYAQTQPRVRYVDVASAMLDQNGRVRADLFRADGLHMNARGYALWTRRLRPLLLRELGADAS